MHFIRKFSSHAKHATDFFIKEYLKSPKKSYKINGFMTNFAFFKWIVWLIKRQNRIDGSFISIMLIEISFIWW